MKMIKVEDFTLSADYDNGHVSNELVIALRIDDETAKQIKDACNDEKPLLSKDTVMIRSDISESEVEEIAKQLANLPLRFEKELDSMDNYEKIEITFKSGETITYDKDKWDDYAFDGKAVIVKKNSTWIGIYNFDDVFCVELK